MPGLGTRKRAAPPPASPAMQAGRQAKLRKTLEEINRILQGLDDEPVESPEAPVAEPPRGGDISVIVGTSKLAEDPAMVDRIMTMVNTSYLESIKDQLSKRHQSTYQRLSRDEVIDRLEMGDAGHGANRVLHIAFRGDRLAPSTVVGCMSSTFQPPWTEDGCGHWGLLVVDRECQGQGIASVLVASAERRLAGACNQIQIEYEYTAGHAYSQRLMDWYEGRCGFTCSSGYPRSSGTQFRKCRKRITAAKSRQGRRERLQSIRMEVTAELAEMENISKAGAFEDSGNVGAAVPSGDGQSSEGDSGSDMM